MMNMTTLSETSQKHSAGFNVTTQTGYEVMLQYYPRWAVGTEHHKTTKGDKMNFDRRPWATQLWCDNSPDIVLVKSSQIGATEWLICDMMVEAASNREGIYILPTDKWRNEFVPRRIDKTIARVPLYRDHTSTEKKDSDMKSQKRFFGRSWRFVGANSDKNFYEAPADTLIFDEFDKCDQNNLIYAYDRLGASDNPKTRIVGNPTMPGFGIDAKFDQSDKKQWFVLCSHCNERQQLDWFVNVVRRDDDGSFVLRDSSFHVSSNTGSGGDADMYCRRCSKSIDRLMDGEWVAEYLDNKVSGYQVSKLFGDARTRPVIAEMFDEFIDAQANAGNLQRFYNNVLGVPYEAAGSRITGEMLDNCVSNESASRSSVIGGVDVGGRLHVVLRDSDRRPVFIGTVADFDELDFVVKSHNCQGGVIDALPETHSVKSFCATHPGWYACRYGANDPKTMRPKVNHINRTVDTGRTESLDALYADLHEQRIGMSPDWRSIDNGDYSKQMQAATRVLDESKNPPRYVWDEGAKADHYHHAENYCAIAARLNTGVSVTLV